MCVTLLQQPWKGNTDFRTSGVPVKWGTAKMALDLGNRQRLEEL